MRSTAVASILAVCGLCSGAFAQGYAGGDGRSLERDLRVGVPKGLTPRASMAEEVRLRNALITGNVGGLRSFRGSVGYTAPDDFRGGLASDATYSFRRDSTSASQFTRPVRGGEGLRYQLYTSTGLATRKFDEEVGRLGATGESAAKAAPGAADSSTAQRGESLTQRLGAMRSTAAFDATRDLTPSVVGYTRVSGGYQAMTASGLLGLRTPDRSPLTTRYPSPFPARDDKKEERPGLLHSIGETAGTSLTDTGAENLNKPILEPVTRTLYQDLKKRMKEQEEKRKEERARGISVPDAKPDSAAPTPPPDTGQPPDSARPAGMEESAQEPDGETRLQSLRDKLLPRERRVLGQNQLKGEKSATSARPGDATDIFDDKTIDLIRRSGGETRAYIDAVEGAKLTPYEQQMKAGQELMGRGKFFDAEERFARALQEREGDVTAMAARTHAQLGAGLYLSAALNVRQLFVQAPEVIALRYAGETIPPPQRLASIAADLRSNIQRAKDGQGVPSVGDSLLLAYVGWQLADLPTVAEGLSQAQRSADASGKPEPLVELLRRTWLEPVPSDTRVIQPK